MPPRDGPNDPTVLNTNHRSFLVTLSARAIGSLGFGLSILAIGLRWLVPMATAPTLGVENRLKQRENHRSRRRLALALPSRLVVPAVPPITANGRSIINNLPHDKHVYFADTLGSQRSSTSTNEPVLTILDDIPMEQSSIEENPPPSTQTSPTTASYLTKPITTRQDDDSFVESDSSAKRSSLSFHLPKKILSFGNKSRQRPGTSATVIQSSLVHGEDKRGRQSNVGFVPPWSSRRKSPNTQVDPNGDTFIRPLTPLKSANFPFASNVSTQPCAVSFFSSKAHHRRVSAPNSRMRTQPYDAPYFALPPTSATFDLRKSPPMFHKVLTNSNLEHVSEDDRGRPLHSPKHLLIKRRSASEGWNNGRRPMI